jgi:hypothetical protein
MAIEQKRGCGYRQVGGLYLVSGKLSAPCDRLPFELSVCPCCGAGVKFTRGFTWIEPFKLLEGDHTPKASCDCFTTRAPLIKPTRIEDHSGIAETIDYEFANCPACSPLDFFGEDGKAGLVWIGKTHYKTPADFVKEGAEMGVSRRIQALPRGFVIGETWIFCAHISACQAIKPIEKKRDYSKGTEVSTAQLNIDDPNEPDHEFVDVPGIFSAFKPTRIERIVKQSEFDAWKELQEYFDEGYEPDDVNLTGFINEKGQVGMTGADQLKIWKKLHADVKRGITLVPVPDDDPDHNKAGK